jgi:hypothetical protein
VTATEREPGGVSTGDHTDEPGGRSALSLPEAAAGPRDPQRPCAASHQQHGQSGTGTLSTRSPACTSAGSLDGRLPAAVAANSGAAAVWDELRIQVAAVPVPTAPRSPQLNAAFAPRLPDRAGRDGRARRCHCCRGWRRARPPLAIRQAPSYSTPPTLPCARHRLPRC